MPVIPNLLTESQDEVSPSVPPLSPAHALVHLSRPHSDARATDPSPGSSATSRPNFAAIARRDEISLPRASTVLLQKYLNLRTRNIGHCSLPLEGYLDGIERAGRYVLEWCMPRKAIPEKPAGPSSRMTGSGWAGSRA